MPQVPSALRWTPPGRWLAALALCACLPAALAQVHSDAWGKAPAAADDRFSNPKSRFYAGPDGWFNTGELRASAGAADYRFNKTTFRVISGTVTAVDGLRVLTFDFGGDGLPAPGSYQLDKSANRAGKRATATFADTSGGQIREWKTGANAGTVQVLAVNGFTYVWLRSAKLQPSVSPLIAKGLAPMSLGFEGAIAPE